jgi:single-stranded-DNA-specific exonuclease
MEAAVARLHRAVAGGEQICFYGDYDVDGVAATSLYLSYFSGIGATARSYIPHRLHEGYGLNEAAVRTLAGHGVSLMVTSDCGSTSLREIELAGRLGMDVIVTDHHQIGTTLPSAAAVINPQRSDSLYPFRGLCSAGLAYRVIQAYRERWHPGDPPLDGYLDLVALATIADIVPLVDENRTYVREGLALVGRGARCGVRALNVVAGVGPQCTSGTVAFKLAPRLNAAGRLDHAEIGVRLLTTESELEAKQIAERLDQLNRERQRLEESTTVEATDLVRDSELALEGAIVVWGRHWHLGVVGIVAARLVERFNRPAVVIAVARDGTAKGSVRTIGDFDVYQALVECADLLRAFGGHPSAAGVTLAASNLPAFRERFSQAAATWTARRRDAPVLHVDAEVGLREVDAKLVNELQLFHPFGAGNPEPTLTTRNLTILSARVVGNGHLKLMVRHGNSLPFEGIGFRMGALADRGLSMAKPVDLAFMPELNRWNGMERIQLRIRDIRHSTET